MPQVCGRCGGRYGGFVPASYLVIIGDREPLAWVLSNQRMAFPGHRAQEVSALREGDEMLLYATRGCFRNPTRDRGRVIGRATATSVVRKLDPPLRLGGRESQSAVR